MKNWKKIALALVGVPILSAGAFASWVGLSTQQRLNEEYQLAPVTFNPEETPDLELGQRIVAIRNGCVECHGQDLGGQMVMDNPAMGRIYASNLTPASLNNWSDGEMGRAIRYGIGKDKQALILMPSHDYVHFSESDLAAVVAYLRAVPAVERVNQSSQLGPVAKTLLALNKAPLLPAEQLKDISSFSEKPTEDVSTAFGAYLAKTACMGCHGQDLKGGPIPGGDPKWPPAADLSPTALSHWSESDFADALKTGVNPDKKKIAAPMPINLTKQFSETEIKALWVYIQSL